MKAAAFADRWEARAGAHCVPGGHACGAAAPQSSGGRAAGTCAPGLRIHTCLRIAAPPAWLSADM